MDKELTIQKFKQELEKLAQQHKCCYDKEGGVFVVEADLDRDDYLETRQLGAILASNSPMDEFHSIFDNWYAQEEETQELFDKVIANGEFTNEEIELLNDYKWDYIQYNIPLERFLNQEVECTLLVDTGDNNYDFTCNTPCPAYGGYEGLRNTASILWLAKQQGYKKSDLVKDLAKGDEADCKGLIQTIKQEVSNTSGMAVLTFLVTMTLEEAIQLKERRQALAEGESENIHYYPSKRTWRDKIVISQNTSCGLFDPWHGGGSIFEIELEKEVILPLKYLWAIEPCAQSNYGYSFNGTYGGFCSEAFGTVKEYKK